ncbi:unnamed protein product, partial [Toxocara canis]
THLGKPIKFIAGTTPEDVKRRVKEEVQDLIRQHQRLPGSILRGILQRFYDKRRYKRDVLLDDIASYAMPAAEATVEASTQLILQDACEHNANDLLATCNGISTTHAAVSNAASNTLA